MQTDYHQRTPHRAREEHKTDFTCPITTGIFSWIAAYAAVELAQQGRKRITPCWRTLKSDGQIIPKYPGGIEAIREKLEAEGHTVIKRANASSWRI